MHTPFAMYHSFHELAASKFHMACRRKAVLVVMVILSSGMVFGGLSPVSAANPNDYEALLALPIENITVKKHLPPGGDPHDYASLAIYWWPNPLTGIPYVHRDGVRNPEAKEYDAYKFEAMIQLISDLAKAYKETGDKRFALNAEARIDAWFLNEKTRMNPALRYAQFIPGVNEASSFGLIEGALFASNFLDAIYILESNNGLTPATSKGLRNWFREFLQWFQTSNLGKEEALQDSNHGVWYDYQIVRYAEFVGDKQVVIDTLTNVPEKRIQRLILPDGKMPSEMVRTLSYDYVCYALNPFVRLARLGKQYGIDIAGYTAPNGASISKAIQYALKNSKNMKDWPGKQIFPSGRSKIVNLANDYLTLRQDADVSALLHD